MEFNTAGYRDCEATARAGAALLADSARKDRERRTKVPDLAIFRRPVPGRWRVSDAAIEMIRDDCGFGKKRKAIPFVHGGWSGEGSGSPKKVKV
jgi:hypothetical protein